jgi:type II secretory pathway pseudopilin PulG
MFFRNERGATTLVEALVAMILTLLIGYAVFSALFSAGRGVQGQQSQASSTGELRQALSLLESQIGKTTLPLAYVSANGNEIAFVYPQDPNALSGQYYCVRYAVVDNSGLRTDGTGALIEQSVLITPSGGNNTSASTDCAYDVTHGTAGLTADASLTPSSGLNVVSQLSNGSTRAFTPVDNSCFINLNGITTSFNPATCPLATAPLSPGAGLLVNLIANPNIIVGNNRQGSLSNLQSVDYINFASH